MSTASLPFSWSRCVLRARHGLWLCVLAGLFVCAGFPPAAHAQYALSQSTIRVGEPVTIMLPRGVDTLRVTYRPQSQIEIVDELASGGDEMITWTPERAGLVLLSSTEADDEYVSVRYASLPWSGLIMLILAGTILLGGASLGIYRLLQAERAAVGPTI